MSHEDQVALATEVFRTGVVAGDADRIAQAVRMLTATLAVLSPADPLRYRATAQLSSCRQLIYRLTRDPAHLDAATELASQALELPVSADADRAHLLTMQGMNYRMRFLMSGDEADLAQSIRWNQRSVLSARAEENPEQLAQCLSNLAVAYQTRFQGSGAVADIDAAIDVLSEATTTALPEHDEHGLYLGNLAASLRGRFSVGGDRADLDSAIAAYTRLLDETPAGDRRRRLYLRNFAIALYSRHHDAGGPASDLDDAEKSLLSATLIPGQDMVSSADLAGLLVDVRRSRTAAGLQARPAAQTETNAVHALADGISLVNHYVERGDRNALADGIAVLDRVARQSDDPSLKAPALATLCRMRRLRYEGEGNPADLALAIEAGEAGLSTAAAGAPDVVDLANGLAAAYTKQYERAGDQAILDRALNLARQAVRDSRPTSPNRHQYLTNLATLLSHQFQVTARDVDARDALDAARQAFEIAPTAEEELLCGANWLAVLVSAAAVNDWIETGAAIAAVQEVAARADPPAHLKALAMSNIGGLLARRAALSGEQALTTAAIDHCRQALALLRPPSPLWVPARLALAGALIDSYHWSGADELLDEALALASAVVGELPVTHTAYVFAVSTLTAALGALDLRRDALRDRDRRLDRIRATLSEAVDLTLDRPLLNASVRTSLAISDLAAYRRGHRPEILERAVTGAREGYRLAATSSGDRSYQASTLIDILSVVAQSRTADVQDELIAVCRQLADAPTAPPVKRLSATLSAGNLLALRQDWEAAADYYGLLVTLLPVVLDSTFEAAHRDRLINELGDTSSDVAAVCLRAGRLDAALAHLELLRGIFMTHRTTERADMRRLSDEHPGPAAEMRQLLTRIGAGPAVPPLTSFRTDSPPTGPQDDVRRLETLTDEIRRLDGFADFRRTPATPPATDLVRDAGTRIIVPLASRFGSYAIVITDGGTVCVPLPDLRMPDVVRHVSAVVGHSAGPRAMTPSQSVGLLAWLWRGIVVPLLPRITTTGKARIHWIPAGLLTFLPLHAAGRPGKSLLDIAISSYAPTIRMLHWSRSRSRTVRARDALIVAMPDSLPRAADEAAAIEELLPSDNTMLSGPAATPSAVLDRLRNANLAHFACHARFDLEDDSGAALVLHDGELTVSDIRQLDLGEADLAFLAACSTSLGDLRRSDEPTHPAAAFQVAGFRHVIGTQWLVVDRISRDLTLAFYRLLGEHPDDVARALHEATNLIRRRHPHSPLLWAQYLHVG
jgi:hypothetical protein